jgi:hypothetical protein
MQQPNSSSLRLQQQQCSQVHRCSDFLHMASAAAAPICTCWSSRQTYNSSSSNNMQQSKAVRAFTVGQLQSHLAVRKWSAAAARRHQQQQRPSRNAQDNR